MSHTAAEFTRLQKQAFALEASVVLAEARLGQANAAAALDLLDRAALAAGQDANLIRPRTARVRARALACLGRISDAENEIENGIVRGARTRACVTTKRCCWCYEPTSLPTDVRPKTARRPRRCSKVSACSARRDPSKIRWLQPEAEPRVSCDARRSHPERKRPLSAESDCRPAVPFGAPSSRPEFRRVSETPDQWGTATRLQVR